MVSAQMPELTVEEDINYMRDKVCRRLGEVQHLTCVSWLFLSTVQLFLSVNEKKADKKLHAEINKSLDSTYRRIVRHDLALELAFHVLTHDSLVLCVQDNMIHNLKHG